MIRINGNKSDVQPKKMKYAILPKIDTMWKKNKDCSLKQTIKKNVNQLKNEEHQKA